MTQSPPTAQDNENKETVEAVAGESNTGWKPDGEKTAQPDRVSLLPKISAVDVIHGRNRQAEHDWPFRFRSSPWKF
jgi:hypothetical protein